MDVKNKWEFKFQIIRWSQDFKNIWMSNEGLCTKTGLLNPVLTKLYQLPFDQGLQIVIPPRSRASVPELIRRYFALVQMSLFITLIEKLRVVSRASRPSVSNLKACLPNKLNQKKEIFTCLIALSVRPVCVCICKWVGVFLGTPELFLGSEPRFLKLGPCPVG